jgi:hypothetical protein
MTIFFSVMMGAFALGQLNPAMEAISKGQVKTLKLCIFILNLLMKTPFHSAGSRNAHIRNHRPRT